MKATNFDDVRSNMMIVPYIVCFIGCLCLATPIRKKLKAYWDKCLAGDEKDLEGEPYEGRATQFTECYDISNPLTYKQGKMRLLNVQIAHLEKQGEDGKE